jgi:quinol monooxygenase YgiN
MAIGLSVQFTIKKGEGAGFEAAFSGAQANVKAEDEGCELYDLFRHISDETKYAMVERWTSKENLEAHKTSPAMKEMVKIAPFLDGAPTMVEFEVE